MQDDRYDCGLQRRSTLDRKIDRTRGFGLDPVAKATQRPVCGDRRTHAGAERIKGGVTGRTLHDRLDLARCW